VSDVRANVVRITVIRGQPDFVELHLQATAAVDCLTSAFFCAVTAVSFRGTQFPNVGCLSQFIADSGPVTAACFGVEGSLSDSTRNCERIELALVEEHG
jgi:hypothetical protein